jgi:hypothetical protein
VTDNVGDIRSGNITIVTIIVIIICVCMYLCACMRICTCRCLNVFVCVCASVCNCVCVCSYVYGIYSAEVLLMTSQLSIRTFFSFLRNNFYPEHWNSDSSQVEKEVETNT